jgi:ABC-type multidrug transport system fused ATPase/permease subunit
VLIPNSGHIEISGISPKKASRKWPGAISYVPQNIFTSDGSVRENVSQGYETELATSSRIWRALELAKLKEYVENLPDGLDAQLGENGSKVSGGQKQRIGIARALFSDPKFLVLDEATSSLDGQTETEISNSIQSLSGSVSVLIVAHRLSTVRKANRVIYLEKGKILASGTFEEVRKKVPDFDKQANMTEV